jgi:hypothetical protein
MRVAFTRSMGSHLTPTLIFFSPMPSNVDCRLAPLISSRMAMSCGM